MINLKVALDQDVLIQFKHGKYVVAVAQGHFVPIGQGMSEQGQPGAPLVVDRLEGHLRSQDDAFILAYQNPANPTEQVDQVVDPEDVAAVWISRKIQVPSGIVMPR